MKKKIACYTLFGAPMGLTISVLMTFLGSLLRGDGRWHFTSAQLIVRFGSELNAVAAQCLGAMVLGAIWANATMIYYDTDWSLLKQTLVHCLACIVPSLAIAFWLDWLPRNWDGLGQWLIMFGSIYMLNWILQYRSVKKKIDRMNERLKELPKE